MSPDAGRCREAVTLVALKSLNSRSRFAIAELAQ